MKRRHAALMLIAAISSVVAAGPAANAARSCAWQARIDPTAVNALYPDQFANYWVTHLPAAPGATLTIKGIYPHARYISFTSYAATLQSVDGINDQRIEPDPLSDNPFLPGHARNTANDNRRYTVTVVFGQRPDAPARNTLYTTNHSGSKSGASFDVIYRLYRPDAGYDSTGLDPSHLPSVAYDAPDGSHIDIPECPYPDVPPNPLQDSIANAGGSNSGGTLRYPGQDPPAWHKFQNFGRAYAIGFTDNGYSRTLVSDAAKPATDMLPEGGFADNPDNKYMSVILSHGYGQLVAFHGKLPRTPDTYNGAATMPSGVDLRYWSLCSNDGPSQRYYACVMDDLVRPLLDENGYYTIVVSTPADRPKAALPENQAKCHVGWLPWGPSGSSVVIERNMLPDPGFTNAIQNAGYGDEVAGTGDYYPNPVVPGSMPQTGYQSAAAFDAARDWCLK